MLVAVSVLMVTLSAAVSALRPDLVLKLDQERPTGLTVRIKLIVCIFLSCLYRKMVSK